MVQPWRCGYAGLDPKIDGIARKIGASCGISLTSPSAPEVVGGGCVLAGTTGAAAVVGTAGARPVGAVVAGTSPGSSIVVTGTTGPAAVVAGRAGPVVDGAIVGSSSSTRIPPFRPSLDEPELDELSPDDAPVDARPLALLGQASQRSIPDPQTLQRLPKTREEAFAIAGRLKQIADDLGIPEPLNVTGNPISVFHD